MVDSKKSHTLYEGPDDEPSDPSTAADGQAQRSWWTPRSKHIIRWSGTEILVDSEIQTHQQMVRHRDPGEPQDPNMSFISSTKSFLCTGRLRHNMTDINVTPLQPDAHQQTVRHRDPGGPRDPNTSADGQVQRSWWTPRSKHISRWSGTEILVDPEI